MIISSHKQMLLLLNDNSCVLQQLQAWSPYYPFVDLMIDCIFLDAQQSINLK